MRISRTRSSATGWCPSSWRRVRPRISSTSGTSRCRPSSCAGSGNLHAWWCSIRRGCGVSDRNLGHDEDWVGQASADLLAVMDTAELDSRCCTESSTVGPFASVPRWSILTASPTSCSWVVHALDAGTGLPRRHARRGHPRMLDVVTDLWGTGRTIEILRAGARRRRSSPRAVRTVRADGDESGEVRDLTTRWVRQDEQHLLPLVSVPTLILHQREDPMVLVEHGRYLRQAHPGHAPVRGVPR